MLESPLDDFLSFFYITQRAAIFNNQQFASTKNKVPQGLYLFRAHVSADNDYRRDTVTLTIMEKKKILKKEYTSQYGRFLFILLELLSDWGHQLTDVAMEIQMQKCERNVSNNSSDWSRMYDREWYRTITDKLVLETLQLFCKHWFSLY
jgi:hypothetical protein